MGNPQPTTTGRRSRRDLEEMVINAGVEVLERDGLGLSVESLTYAKVFAYLEEKYGITVSRASVHDRIWESRDEFRNAVLARMTYDSSLAAVDAMRELMRDVGVGLELTTNEGRREALTRLIQEGAGMAQELYETSSPAQHQLAIKAICLIEADPDLTQRVRELMAVFRNERHERFISRFAESIEQFGGQVNPALGIDVGDALKLIINIADRLVTSAALDANVLDEDPAVIPFRHSDGSTDEWTPTALTILTLTLFLFRAKEH